MEAKDFRELVERLRMVREGRRAARSGWIFVIVLLARLISLHLCGERQAKRTVLEIEINRDPSQIDDNNEMMGDGPHLLRTGIFSKICTSLSVRS